jgi:AraC family transcriptional regulator of adaptative response/methylated-DNA-[protein]-cysteine methyltransferase
MSAAKNELHRREILADPRWAQIAARDKTADGHFWYSVATTKVYCRPSCPSRGAKPANVTIHDTLAGARATGFRACRRCNPDGLSADAENAAIVLKACRLLDDADETPSLAELANAVDLSPSYFHRLFKKATGITPKAYATERRAGRLRAALGKAPTVTAAIYEAGFGSSGRFYERSTRMLGMRPRRYRAGGANEVLTFAVAECSLGAVLVASSAKGVAAILLGDDPEALVRDVQDRFPRADFVGADARYEALVAKVIRFIESPGRGLDLPLDVRGTAFQERVWRALRDVPAGKTVTYAELAARIGAPNATRAVAGACAANRLAVAVPCHRVIRNDGSLSGYRWGVERKHALLARERERARASAEPLRS